MEPMFPEAVPEPTYPQSPGYRRRATSKAAAEAIAPHVGSLKERILAALREGPMTPEQLAPLVGATVHSTRSRCSELCAASQIVDSGQTGPSIGRKVAIKWQLSL